MPWWSGEKLYAIFFFRRSFVSMFTHGIDKPLWQMASARTARELLANRTRPSEKEVTTADFVHDYQNSFTLAPPTRYHAEVNHSHRDRRVEVDVYEKLETCGRTCIADSFLTIA